MTLMICPKAKECPYENLVAKAGCPHKTKHDEMVTGCHAKCSIFSDCPQHCIPYQEEEKKMKCPTCKKELEYSGKSEGFHDIFSCKEHGYNLYIPEPKNKEKPNPSPRDIFQHIKTECERKAFDEFMLWNSNQYRVPWEDSLGESVIYALKKDKPSWYSWLQQKGLVQKEKVKREAWSYSYWSSAIPKTIFAATGPFCSSAQAENAGRANTQERFIKTILLHEWEEEK